MKFDLGRWLTATRNVYFGNASTVRDYRVQLRGNRSVILFGIYLVLLIGISLFKYSQAAGANQSIVEAQRSLRDFYSMTMMLLGAAVCLIAPGLAATTVVMERQRQSLDLIFSAPVTPKYYLVGKMLSSFRYTWMILILALPITAASVVLGGASWSDVIVAYVLLSLQGLVMTAVALLISSLVGKPVSAIVWSYVAAGAYALFSSAVAEMLRFSGGFGRRMDTGEMAWPATLSPFTVIDTARTYTTVEGHQVPNWIFAAIAVLLACKLCLLGAAAVLDRASGREIVGLRIHALVYIALVSILIGYSTYDSVAAVSHFVSSPGMGGGMGMGMAPVGKTLDETSAGYGFGAAFCTWALIIFLPFIACFGYDREMRYWPNGVFSLRKMLDGTPAGGLPFLLAFLLTGLLGAQAGIWLDAHVWLSGPYWSYALYIVGFWVFFWAIGRLVSSFFGGLKAARGLLFATYLLIVALPFPFLTFTTGLVSRTENRGAWDLYILSPVTQEPDLGAPQALVFGLILLLLATLISFYAESKVRARQASRRNYDGQSLQTT